MHDHTTAKNTHQSLKKGGGSIGMPAITIILGGFMAGLFTMTIVNLYRYVLKIMNNG